MTLDMNNTDKLSEFRAEAQRLGIKVEAPSVNRSGATFEVNEKTIYYALAALKGVGGHAVDLIVEARKEGAFTSLADFAARVNPRAINKRVVESLAAAGAFDTIDANRARVFAGADALVAACPRGHAATTSGQHDMFGGSAGSPCALIRRMGSRGIRGRVGNATASEVTTGSTDPRTDRYSAYRCAATTVASTGSPCTTAATSVETAAGSTGRDGGRSGSMGATLSRGLQ